MPGLMPGKPKPYEFREFPKHLPLAKPDPKTGLNYVVVNNRHEEVTATVDYGDSLAPAGPVDPIVAERDALAKDLAAKNAELSELRAAAAKAQAEDIVKAPTLSPLEKKSSGPIIKSESKAEK